ncbi:hypothetical protein MUN78_07020 [Leucobacter allii]|uniref:Uncharacterized protein n=1 Tax=Leucobacter allii TaxID=2932247 RepID=A0ABY4FQK2_9MICO|nr:hypothetical protein [Leucobacter allii]UOQ58568.1 hypothetical protein MUN78_07020 [Leucobacter allii]
MDRFAAAGLVLDALAHPDRRVAVVAARQPESRACLEAVAAAATASAGGAMVKRVQRTNGDESISFVNGSRIIFRSARQSLRGRLLDVIFVHPDVPRHVLDDRQWKEWRREHEPCLLARQGELVFAW